MFELTKEIGFGIGVAGAVLWVLILFLGLLVAWWLEWVDDNDSIHRNFVIRVIMYLCGYKINKHGSDYAYKETYISTTTSKRSDGAWATVLPAIVFFLVPNLWVFALNYPYVIISLVLFFILTYIVRFVRRLTKITSEHTKNKSIHY